MYSVFAYQWCYPRVILYLFYKSILAVDLKSWHSPNGFPSKVPLHAWGTTRARWVQPREPRRMKRKDGAFSWPPPGSCIPPRNKKKRKESHWATWCPVHGQSPSPAHHSQWSMDTIFSIYSPCTQGRATWHQVFRCHRRFRRVGSASPLAGRSCRKICRYIRYAGQQLWVTLK